MPMSWNRSKSPAGFELLRCVAVGDVTGPDAEALMAAVGEGGPEHGLPTLYVTDQSVSLSGDARAILSSGRGETTVIPTAIVLTSAVLRVTVSFLLRVSPNKPPLRLFSTEPEALAWLDEELAKLPASTPGVRKR